MVAAGGVEVFVGGITACDADEATGSTATGGTCPTFSRSPSWACCSCAAWLCAVGVTAGALFTCRSSEGRE